ncbi:hypothetical protein IFM61606_10388 [Aspergillus udagawae]|nr:hypothetical protein IFM61606_10388 [Aspergillus udagawae]
MSSYPTSAEATGTTNVGNNKPIIEPASASWFTDYIRDVKLELKDGTDIPLYNEKLMTHITQITNGGPYVIDHVHSDRSGHFNQAKEDYRLFYIHLNHAEMEIAIGGETQV